MAADRGVNVVRAAATDPVASRGRARALPTWPGVDADWLPARDADDRAALSRRDADGQDLSPAARRRARGRRLGRTWARTRTIRDLTLDVWRSRIARYSGELKNLLRNQEFVAGIGNAYSDEILWAARLAPFRKRSSLAAAEVDALYDATRETLPWAIDELHRLVPPRLEVEQRKFLNVHRKGGEACPRCGSKISEVSAGGFVTSWCRSCQR